MNCRPGDMAVIVECRDAPENIGLFVEVIAADSPENSPLTLLVNDQIWICRAKGLIRYSNILGQTIFLREGPIPDFALRPIRPPAPETDVNTTNEFEVTA
jgi:hypothetical protein